MKKIVVHNDCGKACGKGGDKNISKCGKVECLGLSPKWVSCPQSYPQSFQRLLQTVIPQSTTSTTITTLINIY